MLDDFVDDLQNLSLNDDSNGLQLGLSDERGLISKSQKGFPMLCHMGYSYRLKNPKVKDEKLSLYEWRCAKTGGSGVNCKAKITYTLISY